MVRVVERARRQAFFKHCYPGVTRTNYYVLVYKRLHWGEGTEGKVVRTHTPLILRPVRFPFAPGSNGSWCTLRDENECLSYKHVRTTGALA